MRKVYHNEKSRLGLVVSILFSLGLTAALFGALPFAHRIAKSDRVLDLVKTSTAELPPPVEEVEPPPAPEPEKEQEPPPAPVVAQAEQNIPLSADIEVVLGGGGGLVGYGDVRALTAATALAEETFDVSELEKLPEAISQGGGAYPAEMRKAKIAGYVAMLYVANEEGRVEDVRVDKSSHPEFEKPAIEAARKWRFRPGMREGKPVRTYMKSTMRFTPPS